MFVLGKSYRNLCDKAFLSDSEVSKEKIFSTRYLLNLDTDQFKSVIDTPNKIRYKYIVKDANGGAIYSFYFESN